MYIQSPAVYGIFLYDRSNFAHEVQGCNDILACSSISSERDESLFGFAAAEYDTLFYGDAARKYFGGTGSRNGVVGMIPVVRDGRNVSDAVISTKPIYHKPTDLQTVLGTCSIGMGNNRGTISVGGVNFHAVYPGNDILLLSGVENLRSISIDVGTG